MCIVSCLLPLCVFTAATATVDETTSAKPLAGWYGAFPWIDYYDPVFEAPVVEKLAAAPTYRQRVVYWIGGVGQGSAFSVTLARDPAFKARYAAETLRRQVDAPQEVPFPNKVTAWLWKDEKKAVVVLAEDKAILFEGAIPNFVNLLKFRFDLERVRSALAHPPRTSFEPRLEDFQVIPKGARFDHVQLWVNQTVWRNSVQDEHKNFVYTCVLADQTRVLVCLEPKQPGRVVYIKHDKGQGKVDDLTK